VTRRRRQALVVRIRDGAQNLIEFVGTRHDEVRRLNRTLGSMVDPKKSEPDALYEDADQGVDEARQQVRDAAAGMDTGQLEIALDELEAALAHREAARLRPRDDDWLLTALGAANAIDPQFHGDREAVPDEDETDTGTAP
jgi:hypothetical protein